MKTHAYLLSICFFSGSFSASELENPYPLKLDVGEIHPLKHRNYVAKKISNVVDIFGGSPGYAIYQVLEKTEFGNKPTGIKCTKYEWEEDDYYISILETGKLEKIPKKRAIDFEIILEFSEENKILNKELEELEKGLENTHFNKPE